jgi:hypothetical protein
MPAKDIFHNTIKKALINEGWTITNEPFEWVGLVAVLTNIILSNTMMNSFDGRA